MAYIRKTIDEWHIYTNYGNGWEHELTEMSRKEAMEQMKVYWKNAGHVLIGMKCHKRRVKK